MLGSACAGKRTWKVWSYRPPLARGMKNMSSFCMSPGDVVEYDTLLLMATTQSLSGGGLGSRFGIDVDYARLQLLCHLAKSIRELLRGGNLQLRRIGAIYRFGGTLYTSLNDRADKNSNKQCRDYQNRR